ncbi:MAG TPA: glycosyltransferase family 39 protein [Sphingomicrobium sp.]|nr:glycosyltransferase family 39 protein [Sphingomicrobium sp.]
MLVLAAITLCGLALRLLEAASQPLWTDEALTLVLARWPTLDLLLHPVDPTAGLYYVLHQLLIPDEAGLVAIRGISIVAGTLSIPAIYAVARLGIGGRSGLLAAALLAISPVLVDYSQEARAYALQLFLVLVSAAALLGWTRWLGKGGGTGALAIFACSTVLAFSTHLSGSFWVVPAVPLSAWAAFRYGTASQRRTYLIALVAMALGALPELIRLVWRAYLGGGFVWLAQAGAADALATWSETLLPIGALIAAPFAQLLFMAVLLLLIWRLHAHREGLRAWVTESPVAAAVIGILLFAPILVWLFGFVVVPIFMPRTILMGVAGFILLVCLVDRLEKRPFVSAAAVVAFALALISSGTVRAKEDWNGATESLARSARPGDVILHCASWKYPAFRHAVRPIEGVPNVVLLDWRMVRFDDAQLSNAEWERAYFRSMLEPPMRYLMGQKARLPIRETTLEPFKRAWVVESECGEEGQARSREWLGRGRHTLAGLSSSTPHHSGIRVWLFEPEGAATRRVYSVTN